MFRSSSATSRVGGVARDDTEGFLIRHDPAAAPRHQLGNGPTMNGDGHPFSAFDAAQHGADRLAQLPDGNRIAHYDTVRVCVT